MSFWERLNDEAFGDGFDLADSCGEFVAFGDEDSVGVEAAKIFLFGAWFAVFVAVAGAFVNVDSILNFSAYNIAHKYISYHKLIA